MIVQVPVSVGELLDKLSILRIKRANMRDAAKLGNVERELAGLEEVARAHGLSHGELEKALDEVNGELWRVEDELRVLEARRDFGPRFVELARAVYHTNDRRAALKRRLNLHFGSALVEEKEYADYSGGASSAPPGAPPREP
jgi:hypothetical protein